MAQTEVRAELTAADFVTMPDHTHGIIWITDNCNQGVGAYGNMPSPRSPSRTVGSAVRGFKAAATRRICKLTGQPDLTVWQRNYFEHVVRDDRELNPLREYIATNPLRRALMYRRGRIAIRPYRLPSRQVNSLCTEGANRSCRLPGYRSRHLRPYLLRRRLPVLARN